MKARPPIGIRFVRAAAVVCLGMAPTVASAVALNAVSAHADDGGAASFDGMASAYGVDVTVANPSLPLGLTVEAAGPTAGAHLNSIDQADAFASFPYPGETVAGLPGTAGALFGVPTPQYPMYVAAQAGDQPKDQDLPGIALHAESSSHSASGRAVVGTDGTGFQSSARVEILPDQSVRASASTTLGVNLLNLIEISGVSSSVAVTADANTGKLTRASHLSIGQIRVPGMAIDIPKGTPATVPLPIPIPGIPQLKPLNLPVLPLPLGGQTLQAPDLGFEDGVFTVTLPLPLLKPMTFAIPAQFVLNAFKALGITVTYHTAEESSTGVTAPALTFKYRVPSPPTNRYLNGATDVAFTLGRSTANVTMNPVRPPASGTGALPPGVGSTGGPDTGVDAASGSVAPAGDTGTGLSGESGASVDIPAAPSVSGTPTSLSDGSPAGSASGVASAAPPQLAAYATTDTARVDASGIYLVCVVITAVAFVAVSLLRLLGVRLLWVF